MESGTPGVKSTADGWLARGVRSTPRAGASPFRAVAIGSQLPRILRGETAAVADALAPLGVPPFEASQALKVASGTTSTAIGM